MAGRRSSGEIPLDQRSETTPVGDNDVVEQSGPARQHEQQAVPPSGFVAFFRSSYRLVVQTVTYAGATETEADEAAAAAMEDVLRHWDRISLPRAYARKAAVSHFLKEKQRGNDRTRHRLAGLAEARQDGALDPGLTVWEDRQWVDQLLGSLPAAQREVMGFIVDGFAPSEVAALLGKTPEAVRQNLKAARTRLTFLLLDQAGPPSLVSSSSSLQEEPR